MLIRKSLLTIYIVFLSLVLSGLIGWKILSRIPLKITKNYEDGSRSVYYVDRSDYWLYGREYIIGKYITYDENGKKSYEAEYKNGKMNGMERIWSDGALFSETEYKNGRRNGSRIIYIGRILYMGIWENGEEKKVIADNRYLLCLAPVRKSEKTTFQLNFP